MTEREDYADTGGPIVDIDAQSLAAPTITGRSRRAAAILALLQKAPTHQWTAAKVAAALRGQVPGGVEAFRRVLVDLADRGEIEPAGRAAYRARQVCLKGYEPSNNHAELEGEGRRLEQGEARARVEIAAAVQSDARARLEALMTATRDTRLARIEADLAEVKKVIKALAEVLGL